MADEIYHEPGRSELIKEIVELLYKDDTRARDSATWAFLWHADLSRLQQLKTEVHDVSMRVKFARLVGNIIMPWISKDTNKKSAQNKDEPGTPSEYGTPTDKGSNKRPRLSMIPQSLNFPSSPMDTDKSSSPAPASTAAATLEAPEEDTPQGTTLKKTRQSSRDPKLKALSYDRDKRCVITKIANKAVLENCHIYPNSLGKKYKPSFWDGLSLFWSQEKVRQWKEILGTLQGPEILVNVMTMNTLAHKAWDASLFALKHISSTADGFEMKLEFHWLRPPNKVGHLLPPDQFKNQPSFSSDDECGEGVLFFYDVETHQPIQSGHIITLYTDDPIELPLPSKLLIDMQWHLHRIVALSAAAIDRELELGDDDDDDDDDDDGYDERPLLASSQTTSTRIFSTQSKDDQPSSISGDFFDDKSMQPEAIATTETESASDMMEDL